MKALLSFIFTCLFLSSLYAQSIVVNEIDPFTKQHRVETNCVWAKRNIAQQIGFKLRAVDSICFITLSGQGYYAGVMGEGEKAQLLLDNDSVIYIFSTGLQPYELTRQGTSIEKHFHYQYNILKEDVVRLSQNKLKSIRLNFTDNYFDMEVNDKTNDNVLQLSKVFLSVL